MSRKVRMKFSYQGYRLPNEKWPPFNGLLETTDEEAAQLVSMGNAVYLEDEPVAQHEGFSPLRKISENYDPALDSEVVNSKQERKPSEETGLVNDDSEGLGDIDPEVKRPAINAPKSDWIHYAISQGESEDTAVAMAKADLISKYGASL
jgi:hypothetical protein